MIDKIHGVYYLICDRCEIEAEEEFNEFAEAVEYKKDNGWRSQQPRFEDEEWIDVCPDCQEL